MISVPDSSCMKSDRSSISFAARLTEIERTECSDSQLSTTRLMIGLKRLPTVSTSR